MFPSLELCFFPVTNSNRPTWAPRWSSTCQRWLSCCVGSRNKTRPRRTSTSTFWSTRWRAKPAPSRVHSSLSRTGSASRRIRTSRSTTSTTATRWPRRRLCWTSPSPCRWTAALKTFNRNRTRLGEFSFWSREVLNFILCDFSGWVNPTSWSGTSQTFRNIQTTAASTRCERALKSPTDHRRHQFSPHSLTAKERRCPESTLSWLEADTEYRWWSGDLLPVSWKVFLRDFRRWSVR